MADDERMVNVIIEYMEGVPIPTSSWPANKFRQTAYWRCAAEEILNYVVAHPDWSVIRSVEEFRNMVANFMQKATNFEDATMIFEIAYETALDISDILMAMV